MLQVAGGPELLVILLVMFLLFGPVVLAVVALVKYTDDDGRIDDLEARVAELEGGSDGGGRAGDESATRDGSGRTGGDGRPVEEVGDDGNGRETDEDEPSGGAERRREGR